MDDMFKNCSSLLYLPDISKWDINKLETKQDMFYGCDKSLIIPNKFQ